MNLTSKLRATVAAAAALALTATGLTIANAAPGDPLNPQPNGSKGCFYLLDANDGTPVDGDPTRVYTRDYEMIAATDPNDYFAEVNPRATRPVTGDQEFTQVWTFVTDRNLESVARGTNTWKAFAPNAAAGPNGGTLSANMALNKNYNGIDAVIDKGGDYWIGIAYTINSGVTTVGAVYRGIHIEAKTGNVTWDPCVEEPTPSGTPTATGAPTVTTTVTAPPVTTTVTAPPVTTTATTTRTATTTATVTAPGGATATVTAPGTTTTVTAPGTTTTATRTATVTMAPTATVTAPGTTATVTAQHTVTPTVTKTVTATATATSTTTPQPGTDHYSTPGYHVVNGRHWITTCEAYTPLINRCTTHIWGTQIRQINGKFVEMTGWHFNNLTYLPAPRSAWGSNPLAKTGTWTVDGRQWRTECGTPATGSNACRSFILSKVIEKTPTGYKWVEKWVLNNIVRFS